MKFIGSDSPDSEVETQAVMCQMQSGNRTEVLEIILGQS